MRNTEIKAKVEDVKRLTELARELCKGQDCTVLQQYDTFFKSPSGRLKLRLENTNNRKVSHRLVF